MRLRLVLGATLVVFVLLAAGGYAFYRLVILPPSSEIAEVKDALSAPTADTSGQTAGEPMGPPAKPSADANPTPDITLLDPKPMNTDTTKLVPPKDSSVTKLPPMTPANGTFVPKSGDGAGENTAVPKATPSPSPDQAAPSNNGQAAPAPGAGQGNINAADLPPLPPPNGTNGTMTGPAAPDGAAAPNAGAQGGGNAIDLLNNGTANPPPGTGVPADGANQAAPSERLVPPQSLPDAQIPVTGGTGDPLLNGQPAQPDTGQAPNASPDGTTQPPDTTAPAGNSGPIDLLPAQ